MGNRRDSALSAALDKSVWQTQDSNLGPEAQPTRAEETKGTKDTGELAGQTRQTRETISEQDNRQADGIIP